MRRWLPVLAWLAAVTPAHAALTLTPVADVALTPNETDSIGVFSRWFFHPGRRLFYELYAGRPAGSPLPPGVMTHLAWREYDTSLAFTGRQGSLVGPPAAGDFAVVNVDGVYHVLSVDVWDYRLSSFDEDFNPIAHVTIPLDEHDSNTDQMLGYGNGMLLVGSLHENTATHPRFPMNVAWTPGAHVYPYTTSLQPAGPDVLLSPTFYAWGGSITWNPLNQRFVAVSLDSFPTYQLRAYEYDAQWNPLGDHLLSNDGQWSQGLLWDGQRYWLAWHSGHEHRCGNIELGAFDIDWNPLARVRLTHNNPFPPPLGPGVNVQRPFLTKVGDSLYVSYDQDDYDYFGGTAVIGHKSWQSHVAVVRIDGTTDAPAALPAAPLSVWPQPAHGAVRFALGGRSGDVRADLLDIAGRVVDRTTAVGGSGGFELAGRAAGVYFLRVTDGASTHTRRVVRIE